MAVSPDNKTLATGSIDQTVRLWNLSTGELMLTIFPTLDSEWVAWTPEGYFVCSENGADFFGWHVNKGADSTALYYPASQLYDDYYRPDLVQAKINGTLNEIIAKRPARKDIKEILDSGRAPRIEFLSPRPGELAQRDIEAEITLSDQGGGFGKIIWKLNGVTIGIAEPGRGIGLVKKNNPGKATATKLLTLSPGDNLIEALAYNARGQISSDPASIKVIVKDAISEKPSLHVLIHGHQQIPG